MRSVIEPVIAILVIAGTASVAGAVDATGEANTQESAVLAVEELPDEAAAARDLWNEVCRLARDEKWQEAWSKMGQTTEVNEEDIFILALPGWNALYEERSIVRVYRQEDGSELALGYGLIPRDVRRFSETVKQYLIFPNFQMVRSNRNRPWLVEHYHGPKPDRLLGIGSAVAGLRLEIEPDEGPVHKWSDVRLTVRLQNVSDETIAVAPNLNLSPSTCWLELVDEGDQRDDWLFDWNFKTNLLYAGGPIVSPIGTSREKVRPKNLKPGERIVETLSFRGSFHGPALPVGRHKLFLEYDAHLAMDRFLAPGDIWLHRIASHEFELDVTPADGEDR